MAVYTIFGATGRTGGAVCRALLGHGHTVRAVTRSPEGAAARELARAGAEPIGAELEDAPSLRAALAGADGAYVVQPSFDERGRHRGAVERRQARTLADAVRAEGVPHVVYGAAGVGAPTGVPHFDVKLEVADMLGEAADRLTVVLPSPFLELMTDASFVPALTTWGAEPRVAGWDTPIPWVAVRDVGRVGAAALRDPERHAGRTLMLVGDVVTLRQARRVLAGVLGRVPRRVVVPLWLLRRLLGDELPAMWAFLREPLPEGAMDPATLRSVVPDAWTLEAWARETLAPTEPRGVAVGAA